jgi:Ca2+-transporting ATPase
MNLVTDGLPAIALGVDPGDPDLMQQKPRSPKESIFTRDVKVYLTVMPALMTVLLLIGYFYHQPWLGIDQNGYNHLLEGRTQLLTAFIAMELVVAISARSLRYPVFKVGLFKNKFLWIAIASSFALQLFILYVPGVQAVFDVQSPEPMDWAIAALFAAIVFSVLETGKYITSRKRS